MLRGLLLPAAAAVALVMFAAALDGLSAGRDAEDLRQLEEAVGRADFRPIMEDCRRLVLEGITTPEEVQRVLGEG